MADAGEGQIRAQAADEAVPFDIPGATGGKFRIQVLNQDVARGVVTSIVHLPPGGRIPAHRHRAGAEMHYVLEGDMVEAGQPLGPGAFLTHAAGVVHGPHESRGGAKVLTVQQWQSTEGDFDFEVAEGEGGGEQPVAAPAASSPPRAADEDGAGRQPAAEAAEGIPGAADTPAARREAEQSLGKGYG